MAKKKVEISIVIPAYNEERTIKRVIININEIMKKTNFSYELLVINDGSRDRTQEIVEEITKKEKVILIKHLYNKGYGAALKTGIRVAKGELILITDSDATYPTEIIPKLLSYTDKYDMVVGARIGKHVKIPFFRKPAKKIISALTDFLTNRRTPDLNSGLRVFKKSIALEFFNLFPSGFSFTSTLTLACLTNDYSIKYIPTDYYKREGKSAIKPFKDFSAFITLIIRVVTYFKPFKIFSFVSLILFLWALSIFFYSYLFLDDVMDITIIILLVSSLQTFFFGLIADLIVKGRKK